MRRQAFSTKYRMRAKLIVVIFSLIVAESIIIWTKGTYNWFSRGSGLRHSVMGGDVAL